MASEPRVTIGLPVYNGERYLREALDSILGQAFEAFVLVIADDASTDSTQAICREYAERDPRVRHLRHPRNVGLAANFNFALDQARTEYFKWMGYDDAIRPAFLQQCVEALDARPDTVVCYSRAIAIDEHGAPMEDFFRITHPPVGRTPSARFHQLTMQFADDNGRACHIYQHGLIRTAALRRTRRMPKYLYGDQNMMAELLILGPSLELPEELMLLRHHRDSAATIDLARARRVFDPYGSHRLPWRLYLRRKYFEYVVSALRAPVGAVEKAKLLWYACVLPARRWFVRRRYGVDERAHRAR